MVKSLFVALLLAACSGPSKSPTTTSSVPATADDPTCPVTVAGTSVTAEDTASGAALVFVTTSDVAELRKRASALAKTHNDHHTAMGPLPTGAEQGATGGHDHHAMAGGDHAGHQMGGAGSMIGVHSKATAEDIEGGAKVTFIAFPDGIAKLQGELRMHAQHLASGTCKMDH